MSILTKEVIQKILNDDWLLMDDCEGLENCTVIKELARMALAAMDSKPVAWREPFTGLCVSSIFYQDGSSPLDHGYEPLYSAPQEPVVTGKWIPVSERMPEIRKGWLDLPVIIAVRGEKNGAEAMYCSDGKFRWGRDEQPIDDVTHWMPLPAAPQEVKGE